MLWFGLAPNRCLGIKKRGTTQKRNSFPIPRKEKLNPTGSSMSWFGFTVGLLLPTQSINELCIEWGSSFFCLWIKCRHLTIPFPVLLHPFLDEAAGCPIFGLGLLSPPKEYICVLPLYTIPFWYMLGPAAEYMQLHGSCLGFLLKAASEVVIRSKQAIQGTKVV